jgi:SAM-dependent methyltransferase
VTVRSLLSRMLYSEPVLGTVPGYRRCLRRRHRVTGPHGRPVAPWRNSALKSRREWEAATEQVDALGLYSHPTPSKNWDSLAMVASTLEHAGPSARILDAGSDVSSVILPWLFLYGYRHLVGINVAFTRTLRRGPIRYAPGDITRSGFADNSFDVVVCQSVIEHGVEVRAYLAEMSRVLRPGGLLMTSMDYYPEPTATGGIRPYGMGYHVFSRGDILAMIEAAGALGLAPNGPVDLSGDERAVTWETYGLSYTYLLLTLRKAPTRAEAPLS